MARRLRFSDLFNAAGALTLARIPLAVASSLVKHDPLLLAGTLGLFILTDVLDGPVARRTGTSSRAGAVADGWADKIFMVNFAWCLELAGHVPLVYLLPWFIREILQAVSIPAVALRYAMAEAPEPQATMSGRVCTVSVTLAMLLALVGAPLARDAFTLLGGLTGLQAGLSYLARDRFWERWRPPRDPGPR
ncbi:MAG: CDP-alcohol phosphatidyltransferase family protein [Alphaproteobacteria bacterium]|nr:CDP-alcohol phosphatidyltransferase family protein [Alphaproteobacteria bacterium]